ncbi:MAG: hypothetical protein IH571_02935, partial [Acholeplasmataceae bacterium]|nr:hypothetical protein [Acholeplasmataceae bacterium]
MLDFLVASMQISFWISLLGGTSVLFLMRLYASLKGRISLKKLLFVLFTPFSIGFYLTFGDDSIWKRLYEGLVVVCFLLTLIG